MPQSKNLNDCQSRETRQMSCKQSPFTSVLTSEAANPQSLAVHIAGLGFSSTTGNVCLHLSTVALHNFLFGTRRTRPRVTNVRTRMVTAGELLITDIPARDPLCGSGLHGRKVRALVRKHFATTVARHLSCNLTGRTRSRMTEYGARMTASSFSRTSVAAGVGCR